VQKWWSVLFGAVNLAALLLFVISPHIPGWWLPKDVSTFGYEVDFLYYAILYITGFFFVLTEAIMVYCMWRYTAVPGKKAQYVHGNHRLEWFWTTVTGVILLFVAFSQVSAWERIKYQSQMPGMPDRPAIDHFVTVSARQFEWRIRYPDTQERDTLLKDPARAATVTRLWSEHPSADDIQVVNDLHVWAADPPEKPGDPPRGGNVRVYLMTRDVIHSLGLPNLRLMQDALPGKNIPVWFQIKPGEFNTVWDEDKQDWVDKENWPIACKELCGWGHYKMQGRLRVHKDKADYDKWLAKAKEEQDRHTP
jgi:cytochrome c oxidase subunit 2